jgi:hypothetical protein
MQHYRDSLAKAYEALEYARQMPHGPLRSKAMKEASVMRLAAEDLLKPNKSLDES